MFYLFCVINSNTVTHLKRDLGGIPAFLCVILSETGILVISIRRIRRQAHPRQQPQHHRQAEQDA